MNQPASSPAELATATTRAGTNVGPSVAAIRNVAVYGDPSGGSQPMVNDLTPANIDVNYTDFGVGNGTVAVTITNYQFQFVIPIIGTTIHDAGLQHNTDWRERRNHALKTSAGQQ